MRHATITAITALAALGALACAGGPSEPAVATRLLVSVEPADAVSGLPLGTVPSVRIVGPGGQLVRTDGVVVTIRATSGNVLAAATASATTLDGVATFTGLTLDGFGSTRLVLETDGLAPDTTNSLAVRQLPAAVVIDRQPEGAVSGRPLEVQPTVSVRDHAGLLIATSAVRVDASKAAGAGALSGTTSVMTLGGIATFTDLVLDGEGMSTLGFVAGTSPVTLADELPLTLPAPLVLADITVGGNSSCGIRGDGVAFCWGVNSHGQLGINEPTRYWSLVPRRVVGTRRWSRIAMAYYHACGLVSAPAGEAGMVRCWGFGGENQLGPAVGTSPTSVPIASAARFTDVVADENGSCALATDSVPHCWGHNGNGGLGVGDLMPRATAAPVSGTLRFTRLSKGGFATCGVTTARELACWGGYRLTAQFDGVTIYSPTVYPEGRSYDAVDRGAHSVCALESGAGWRCFELNIGGEFGDGTKDHDGTSKAVTGGDRFVTVSVGYQHACGLTSAGEAWCWGQNTNGQLGDGTTSERLIPTRVVTDVRFTRIDVSYTHTCAIALNGNPWCWGINDAGQLGDGTEIDRAVPTLVAIP